MAVNWSSSGVATVEAITSGLAPGSCAVTAIVGKSTFGSAETGRSRKQTAPNAMIPAIRRAVAIGRRMKISGISWPWSARWFRGRLDFNLDVVGEAVLPVGHHLFAWRKPLLDDGEPVPPVHDEDVDTVRNGVFSDDIDVVAVRAGHDAPDWNRDRVLANAEHKLGGDELSRPQVIARIGNLCVQGDSACRRGDLIVDEAEFSVGQRLAGLRPRVNVERGLRLGGADFGEIVLRDGKRD